VKLEKVEVIFNSALEDQFRNANLMFESKFNGHSEFAYSSSKMQQKYLSNLLARYVYPFLPSFSFNVIYSKNLVPNCNSNPISAWHGVSQKNLDSICWYGLLSLASTDAGIFLLLFICYYINTEKVIMVKEYI
jgi:hypothetical protein